MVLSGEGYRFNIISEQKFTPKFQLNQLGKLAKNELFLEAKRTDESSNIHFLAHLILWIQMCYCCRKSASLMEIWPLWPSFQYSDWLRLREADIFNKMAPQLLSQNHVISLKACLHRVFVFAFFCIIQCRKRFHPSLVSMGDANARCK